jgi:hypothetical protein
MTASERNAGNDIQNAAPAMTTVSVVAARREVEDTVSARVRSATP